eukprot:TsM_000984800 transcript=TsM_000984800 gene=TsM_000984800
MPDCTLEDLVVSVIRAMHAGEIYEFTVNLRTPNLVQIFILHPTCGRGQMYDYFTDTSQPETFEGRECTGQEGYNPMFRTCVQRSVSDAEKIDKVGIKQDSPTTSPSMPCTVVKARCSLVVNANYSGFQISNTKSRSEIGDRIGILPANLEAIGCTSSTRTAAAHLVYLVPPSSAMQEGKKVLTLTRLVGKRYRVSAAVATAPSSMLFKGRFETSGIKRVIAAVYTDTHSTMPLARTLERIINVKWSTRTLKGEGISHDGCAMQPKMHLPDGEVIYQWASGDGSPVETTLASEIRHVF